MSKVKATVGVDRQHKLTSAVMKTLAKDTFLDGSFNRSSCWDKKQETKFLTSLVAGQAPSKIVVANVQKCRDEAIVGSFDYEYFNNLLLAGFKLVAIDGNNRTQTIMKYLNGQASIEPGEYDLPSGVIEVKKNQTTFNKHPDALIDHIQENILISICEYVTATRKDLSRLFTSINNGEQLNAQEKRNAELVPYAKWVRDTVVAYGKAFNLMFKKGNFRMKCDEQIVSLSVLSTYGPEHGLSRADRDNAYTDNSTVYNHIETKGGKKNVIDTLSLVEKYGEKGFNTTTLTNLFMLVHHINQSKIKILNEKEFFKWFMITENRRIGNTKRKLCTLPENGNDINYAGTCASTRVLFLVSRFTYILEDFEKIPSGIVVELDKERIFTRAQRYQAWVDQDGVCPRTGKVIPEEEINNYDKWAADHVFPHSKGGKRTQENCELVCRKYNESKGNRPAKELIAA